MTSDIVATDRSLLGSRRMMGVFLAFAFAYFLSSLLRAAPATLAGAFSRELGLAASDLGLLAGAYFLGFSLTQLPLGTALDRFGPKSVSMVLLTLALVGCLLFASASSLTGLVASRMLIGVGVSACLMAPLTAFRTTLTPQHQLRANAWMLMTGSLGMLASTLPLHALLPHLGWRGVYLTCGGLLLASLAWIAWQVPSAARRDRSPTQGAHEGHERASPQSPPPPMAGDARADGRESMGYRAVFAHPRFVQLLPAGFFIYGGVVAMQALWAAPWMTKVAGYDDREVAFGLFGINAAMLVTFLLWGVVTPRLVAAGGDMRRWMARGMVLPLVLLPIIIALGPLAGAPWWALWCVSCTFVTLSQPLIAQEFPSAMAGRALSAYNLAIFVGIFVVQWGLGIAIDRGLASGWSMLTSFRAAMLGFWTCSVAAFAWYAWQGRVIERDHERTSASASRPIGLRAGRWP